jgi:hypothetical protein
MTPTPRHQRPGHPGEHAVLGFVARDPALAAVAARQRALLDDAVTHRRPSRRDAADPYPSGHRWSWLLLLRSVTHRRCPEATT